MNTQETFNTAEYPDMVRKLSKSGAEIVASLTPSRAHLVHMAIGIVGEVNELNESVGKGRENTIEELGDLEFFVEGAGQALQDLHLELKAPLPVGQVELTKAGHDFLESVKRFVIYEKSAEIEKLVDTHRVLKSHLLEVYKTLSFDRNEVLTANHTKLMKKRYKSGTFSNEQAQTRADKIGTVEAA